MTTKVTGSVLADTAVTAGNYGGATTLQTVSVDAQGRITYAANLTSGVITAGTIGQAADIIVPTIRYNALGQIVAATNNTIRIANTVVTGVVQLADSVSNTSTTAAATASAVKAAYDAAGTNAASALTSAQANTGSGLIIVGSRANSAFAQANLAYGQANTSYGSFDKANSASGVAASAFGQANLAFNTANSASGVAASSFGQANLAFSTANSAFNASNLSSGTLPSARLSGSYTGITAVGGINTSQTGSAPIYGVRAWGAFTALGATLGAGNLSCSRTGAGVYVMTFTTPMPNANYAVSAMVDGTPGNLLGIGIYTTVAKTTSGFSLWAVTGSTAYDLPFNVIVVG
jgi:hypothetical protein